MSEGRGVDYKGFEIYVKTSKHKLQRRMTMVEFIPNSTKASFYHWHQREGLKDVKAVIQKAANEARITLGDAHELFKEIKGRNTDGLANTGDSAIVVFFKVNWKKLTQVSEELLHSS